MKYFLRISGKNIWRLAFLLVILLVYYNCFVWYSLLIIFSINSDVTIIVIIYKVHYRFVIVALSFAFINVFIMPYNNKVVRLCYYNFIFVTSSESIEVISLYYASATSVVLRIIVMYQILANNARNMITLMLEGRWVYGEREKGGERIGKDLY